MGKKRETGPIIITEEMRANPCPIDADKFMQALAKAYSKETGQTWVPVRKSAEQCLPDTHVEIVSS